MGELFRENKLIAVDESVLNSESKTKHYKSVYPDSRKNDSYEPVLFVNEPESFT